MKAEVIGRTIVRDPDFRASEFPGAVQLPSGEIVMLFTGGSGFESSDARLVQVRSTDGGASWKFEGQILDPVKAGYTVPYTFCAKPTLLPSGELIAAGYGFLRDHPEMGLSDYAEKYKKFPPMENDVLRSSDGGHTWSMPEKIVHPFSGLELSGPALSCRDGKICFFASPFQLNSPMQTGLTFESGDGGHSWTQKGTFFSSPDIAAWEVRGLELPSGRIVLVLWSFDLKAQKHLNNHLVWSDDGGCTWSKPVDTGLRGQASNLLLYEEKIGVLQARREGNAPGIWLSMLDVCTEEKIRVGEEICLWDASGKANTGNRIEEQFAALKFGQPSMLRLNDGTWLLLFWQCTGEEYHIETWKIRLHEI